MAPEAIGIGTLERLSALPTGAGATLSVYLDLESEALCTPAALDSLSSEPDLACARADIEQVRNMVAADAALKRPARGAAIFSCAEAGILEFLRLPCAVKPLVALDTAPWLEPLVDMITFGDRAVAVLGPHTARLLRGSATTLTEFATLEMRSSEHGGRRGLRLPSATTLDLAMRSDASKIAEQLLRAHRRRALTDLVIIAPEPTTLDAALDPELRAVLRGVINADLTHASGRELVHIVRPLLDGAERARERAALISWENSLLSEHGAAARGLRDAFAMLEQRRVAVLLIADGARLTAGLCRRCGRVSTGPGGCDFDGARLVSIDAVAHAIDLATDQHAKVMMIRQERDRLIEQGGIATLARSGNEAMPLITATQAPSLPAVSPPTVASYYDVARRSLNNLAGEKGDAGITHAQPIQEGKAISWLEH
jgi:hypothetical protein